MPHFLKQLEAKKIVQHRLVVVRIAQAPIGIRRHAEQRHLEIVAQLVMDLDPNRLLGETGGGLPKDLESGQALKIGGRTKGTATAKSIDDGQRALDSG